MKLMGAQKDSAPNDLPRHIIVKLAKIKDKENFKGSKRKKEFSHIRDFPAETCRPGERGMIYSKP